MISIFALGSDLLEIEVIRSALSEKRIFKSESVQLINLGCQSSHR